MRLRLGRRSLLGMATAHSYRLGREWGERRIFRVRGKRRERRIVRSTTATHRNYLAGLTLGNPSRLMALAMLQFTVEGRAGGTYMVVPAVTYSRVKCASET